MEHFAAEEPDIGDTNINIYLSRHSYVSEWQKQQLLVGPNPVMTACCKFSTFPEPSLFFCPS